MIKKLPLLVLILSVISIKAQTLKGTIYDEYLEPFYGATVKVGIEKTTSTEDGTFSLTTSAKLPFTLEITAVGFQKETLEITDFNQDINIILKENLALDQVVISASRAPERVIESPVTIERIGLTDIKRNTSLNFYDGLVNLKEVDANENSIAFKSVNTRGFSPFENTRFVQLIDGIDNSIPIFNFTVGNLVGISELDVESVEILPGAASALYGANAFNGILLTRSKNPFEYSGISTYVKTGITSQEAAGTNPFYNVGARFAYAFSNKFAAKVNVTYFEGEDWHATDTRNTSGIGGQIIDGYRDPNNPNNPNNTVTNYDGVNVYGDEIVQDLQRLAATSPSPALNALAPSLVNPDGSLILVSRSGYQEKDLVDYKTNNLKTDASLHYRPNGNSNLEFIWNTRYSRGNNAVYQGINRYSLKDFALTQHKLEIRGKNFFVRGYHSQNESGNTFDTRFAGIALNEAWKPSSQWYGEYLVHFANTLSANPGNYDLAHQTARNVADDANVRLTPGTPQFTTALNAIISDDNLGVKLFDKSSFINADANLNLKDIIDWGEIQVGGSFRQYNLNSRGTIYTDADSDISFDEFGLYTQLQKKFIDDRLKFTGSIRYDKSQNFEGNVSPRLSLSYGLGENKDHVLRASFQTGFRNPTTQDQYIGFGGASPVLGTAADNLSRYTLTVNNVSPTAPTGQSVITGEDVINRSFSDLSVRNGNPERANYNLVKPEKVKSYEAGYRGVFNITDTNILEVDFNGYYNDYEDFLTEKLAWVAHYGTFNADGTYDNLIEEAWNSGDLTRFSVKTNSSAEISSYGIGLGVKTKLFKKFDFGIAYNWARFTFDRSTDVEFKPGFNTPEHKLKVQFGNPNVFKNFGFNLNARWQNSFLWESRFLDGTIEARTVLDAQVNYSIPKLKSRIKLGATNLGGKEYQVAPGSALIGSMYYVSWTIND